MFEDYVPKKFCREFVEVKKTGGQIIPIMACVLGLKPLMDDWIEKSRLNDYLEVCKLYNLHVRLDSMFIAVHPSNISEKILGKECITSTSALGVPIEADTNGRVHLFLSKDKANFNHCMWYPLIIKNRLIPQPRADTLRYGFYLGYPECCVRYFRHFNNWSAYNFLFEIYKSSAGRHHYLCNPLTKDRTYSYIYHMPCTFSCRKTIEHAGKLRHEMKKREPEFVKLIDEHLKLPCLVLYERHIYGFRGRIGGDRLYYNEVYAIDLTVARRNLTGELEQGDNLTADTRNIFIYKGKELINTISIQDQAHARENPFIIQFR